MNVERVKTFFAMLSGIPDERLVWSDWREGPTDTFYVVTDENLLGHSDSRAHPVGWACAYPEFRKQGLHFYRGCPKYLDKIGWRAVAVFFDFAPSDIRCVFGQDYEIETKSGILKGILYALYRERAIDRARYDLFKGELK